MRHAPIDERCRSQILDAARKLLSNQMGVIETARILSGFVQEVDPEVANILHTFSAIDTETDDLPVGDVRQHWSAEALKRRDREIAVAEDTYRDDATTACRRLLKVLTDPPLCERISDILLEAWDPIGVKNHLAGRKEYEKYVPGIYELVRLQASSQEIAAYLWRLEREKLGFVGDHDRAERVARQLSELT